MFFGVSSQFEIWRLQNSFSLDDAAIFVTADADSDLSSEFSEKEEESSEEEMEVDNEERSTNTKRCRRTGGSCRRSGKNSVNNFLKENLENIWKTEMKGLVVPVFSGESGIKIDFTDSCNELDIFKCFITDEFIDYIRKDTNNRASCLGQKLERCNSF